MQVFYAKIYLLMKNVVFVQQAGKLPSMPRKKCSLRELKPRVRVLMAERNIRSVSELSRRLNKLGVEISIPQLGRLIDGKTDHWNVKVIRGLITVLECELGDLWQLE